MPAAAVIPAPIAYSNVAAVKKLVVGFLMRTLNLLLKFLLYLILLFFLIICTGNAQGSQEFWVIYLYRLL